MSQMNTMPQRRDEQTEKLLDLSASQQQTAIIVHDARNKLNAISANAEALFEETGSNPSLLPYMGHIRNQVTNLAILLGDLLEIEDTRQEAMG